MGRGRKMKINADNSTLKKSKSEIAKREAEKIKLEEFESIRKTPPSYLPYLAKLEYKRIMPLFEDLPISDLDLTLVVSYCQLYAHWRQLNKDINKNGQIVVELDEEGKEKSRRLNPSFNAMMNTQKELRAVASTLGMSMSSRMSLVIADDEEEESVFKNLEKKNRG